MTRAFRSAVALAVGLSLTLVLAGPAGAQELPTGAARIVEKVQTRIFISKSSLTFHVAAILENQPAPGGG
jgi:hypothetical protein